jgi:hypothetical protein
MEKPTKINGYESPRFSSTTPGWKSLLQKIALRWWILGATCVAINGNPTHEWVIDALPKKSPA